MTKQEIEDKYFVEYLKWCANAAELTRGTDLLFWLDRHFPTIDNFWEWITKYKVDDLQEGDGLSSNDGN